jgi:3',5'-cyclic AMP phosphodiesterase CpdA
MYRIAHISDLHVSDIDPGEKTNLQWIGQILAQVKFKVNVVADKHNEYKLAALKNKLRELKPELIVVTGDITNYGDRKSFQKAVEILRDLKETAKAQRIICIPGNHDCLAERVANLRAKSLSSKLFIWGLSLFNQETALGRKTSFDQDVRDLMDKGDALTLLQNYQDLIKKDEYGEVNPSIPVSVPTPWGEIIFFLFNSTNDPGYMANEGKIGQFQYNLLNQYLSNPDEKERFARAVRIALLHHHPINNPNINADVVERGYDAMIDGSSFMTYAGNRGFHLILHGHQHVPYMWKGSPDIPNIAAAGSATAGDNPNHGSFNVIDLLNPFEAIYRRFDYKQTGFEENVAEGRKLEIKSISNIRITPEGEPERAEDRSIRTLFEGRKEAYDDSHQYQLLDYKVVVSPAQLYTAEYRRKGKVVGSKADTGLYIVITGSPEMKRDDMGISAQDANGNTLQVDCVKDFPNQKVLLVHHYTPLTPGAEFDLTLKFKWQASASEPNDFDGINLMYFKHPVETLRYQAQLPWQPIDPKVISYAITEADVLIPSLKKQADGTHLYSFEIEKPKPLAYLIWFKKGSI